MRPLSGCCPLSVPQSCCWPLHSPFHPIILTPWLGIGEGEEEPVHVFLVPSGAQSLPFSPLSCPRHSRASLQVLGTVGEPINPEAWLWYHQVVGAQRCPIVDTFWQTETVSNRFRRLGLRHSVRRVTQTPGL